MNENIWPVHSKSCDICKDKIGLYTPYYTIKVRGWMCKADQLKANPMVLCQNCYHAYENFLKKQETEENHKRNYMDLKGV